MKSAYICEKCHEVFDLYEQCYQHESHHQPINIQPSAYHLADFQKYSKDSIVPTTLFLGTEESYEPNTIRQNPAIYEYKLVKFSPEVTKQYIDAVAKYNKQQEEELVTRNLKLAEMLEILAADSNCPLENTTADDQQSYYTISRLYKNTYGKYYE